MAMTWVICGAGRGVGKTHLVRKLCVVLPDAVHAKRGCGRRRAGGPTNFFETSSELDVFLEEHRKTHAHIVIECNESAREGKGDVTIFIDGRADKVRIRSDVEALKSRADIIISSAVPIRDWRRVLRDKLQDSRLRENVCDVLMEQKKYLCKGRVDVRTKVWFAEGGVHIFGAGLARLLEHIDRCGTLREATEAASMSYRHAWGLIKIAEKHCGKPLIDPHPGGAGGGRSSLSEHGRYLLGRYQRITQLVAKLAEECFSETDINGGGDE